MSNKIPTKFFFDALPEDAEPQTMAVERERRQAEWLHAYEVGGWRRAGEQTGVSDETVLRWLRVYPDFAAAHANASAAITLRLERIIDEIAMGDDPGSAVQLQAIQFRLKALRPDVYRERSTVQVDQRLSVASDGEGGRARLMLAEWSA